MELIPVLDLMGGAVVHARRGERDRYRPMETPLCAGADPFDIADALLRLAPFRTLYIADLDAIRGTGGHDAVIAELHRRHPQLAIWVDAGEGRADVLARRLARGLGRPVAGTEAMADSDGALAALRMPGVILSLDHDAAGPIGPEAVHGEARSWPDDVIVMTLARVGSDAGPDFERLAEVRAKAGARRVHAAGGVRSQDDLARLVDAGAAGVLLASALHDGRVPLDAIARFTA